MPLAALPLNALGCPAIAEDMTSESSEAIQDVSKHGEDVGSLPATFRVPVIHVVDCHSMGRDAIALRLANSLWR
jgi:hypothetical protein